MPSDPLQSNCIPYGHTEGLIMTVIGGLVRTVGNQTGGPGNWVLLATTGRLQDWYGHGSVHHLAAEVAHL